MSNLKEKIERYVQDGFTVIQARYKTAQEIILSKIEKSIYVDKVLLKGGIVMYNMTKEQRRTTSDLDLDFIRIDISKEDNVRKFIEVLNKKDPEYHILIKRIKDLHQDDYKGKNVVLEIKDSSSSINFSMDIGVHTLLGIEQDKMYFSIGEGKKLSLWVNPPEQIFSEKLFSLAKIGPTSTRYKDVGDMYYLIKQKCLRKSIVRKCLDLLVIGNRHGFIDAYDVITNAEQCLNSDLFSEGYDDNRKIWLDIEYKTLRETILEFIEKL